MCRGRFAKVALDHIEDMQAYRFDQSARRSRVSMDLAEVYHDKVLERHNEDATTQFNDYGLP